MALSTIPTRALTEQGINFRNLIINGDMSIAQRGTSTSGLSSGATFGAVDRFRTYIVSGGTWTMSQDSDVPTGQGFAKSLKLDCTTANGSLSAGSLLQFQTPLEGQNLQMLKKGTSNAESVTWSFWVRSAKTGTYICEIRDVDNSRSISKSYTISSADTWEKKTITFDGDTTGTLGNDNGKSFELIWWLVGGTSYTSGTLQTSWGSQTDANRAVGVVNLADSTANDWYITGVQLEVGTSASDFEFLPYDVTFQRCQRYYEICEGGKEFYVAGSSNQKVYVPYSTKKRATPSVTKISSAENCASSVTVDGGSIDPTISARVSGNNVFATGASKYFEAKFSADAEL
jgi:hypothetical protein